MEVTRAAIRLNALGMKIETARFRLPASLPDSIFVIPSSRLERSTALSHFMLAKARHLARSSELRHSGMRYAFDLAPPMD
jgi:hypothetical protein